MEDEDVGLPRVRLMAGSNLLEKGNLQDCLSAAAAALVRRSSRCVLPVVIIFHWRLPSIHEDARRKLLLQALVFTLLSIGWY